MSRTTVARDAFQSGDLRLSLAAHQANELSEIASGRNEALHSADELWNSRVWHVSAILSLAGVAGLASGMMEIGQPVSFMLILVCSTIPVIFACIVRFLDSYALGIFVDFERSREEWEVDHYPEGEVEEMVWIYRSHGISMADARTVAETLCKYPRFWVDHMLVHEVGVLPRNKGEHVSNGWISTGGSALESIRMLSLSLLIGGVSSAIHCSSSVPILWLLSTSALIIACLFFPPVRQKSPDILKRLGCSLIGVGVFEVACFFLVRAMCL